MLRSELIAQIRQKKSYLCIGLDTDITKIPSHLLIREDPIFEFNKAIIDATKDLCVSYKINTAFYESLGEQGWSSMQKTIQYIPKNIFTIADAKRGDIGNTGLQYAKAFFETMQVDSITVAPYMGKDSVLPFLSYPDKWAIVLALTSNDSATDFQYLLSNQKPIYQHVLSTVSTWATIEQLMFVVGATKASLLQEIRNIVPNHFLLIPGVGTQGGSLDEVSKWGMNKDIGILVNVSRQIIYAGQNEDFAVKAREQASLLQQHMATYLS
jgi:orotidine 5'-phosphate decarboxylase, subfamily 2